MTDKEIAKPIDPNEQIYRWLVEGQRTEDIAEAVADKWPQIDVELAIGKAIRRFAATANCDRQVLAGWAFEAYRELYRRLLAVGDFANAMRAVNALIELQAKTKINVHTEEENDAGTTTDV